MTTRANSAAATIAEATSPSLGPPIPAGTVCSAVAITRTLHDLLADLKEHEGRLIYAEHLLRQEYSRVYSAIRHVKALVQSSVVLSVCEYNHLLDAAHGVARPFQPAGSAADAVGGAGAGAADAAAHTCTRRSIWNYSSCPGCRRDYDSELDNRSSVSREDSE